MNMTPARKERDEARLREASRNRYETRRATDKNSTRNRFEQQITATDTAGSRYNVKIECASNETGRKVGGPANSTRSPERITLGSRKVKDKSPQHGR